jgi:hypothetical protein
VQEERLVEAAERGEIRGRNEHRGAAHRADGYGLHWGRIVLAMGIAKHAVPAFEAPEMKPGDGRRPQCDRVAPRAALFAPVGPQEARADDPRRSGGGACAQERGHGAGLHPRNGVDEGEIGQTRLRRAEIAGAREADIALPRYEFEARADIAPGERGAGLERGAHLGRVAVVDQDHLTDPVVAGQPIETGEENRPRMKADHDRGYCAPGGAFGLVCGRRHEPVYLRRPFPTTRKGASGRAQQPEMLCYLRRDQGWAKRGARSSRAAPGGGSGGRPCGPAPVGDKAGARAAGRVLRAT